jgi:hypothetical protein
LQLERRHRFEALNEGAQGLEILVLLDLLDLRKAPRDDQGGTAQVADLVSHRAHQDPRISQQVVEAEILTVAQVFG